MCPEHRPKATSRDLCKNTKLYPFFGENMDMICPKEFSIEIQLKDGYITQWSEDPTAAIEQSAILKT